MARINDHYRKLSAGYLFPEIGRRVKAFAAANPSANIIRLGIGDTTQPLPQTVLDAMRAAVDKLGRKESYSGYGDSEGVGELRQAIAAWYGRTNARVDATEVFVSDGAKSDSANLQSLFSTDSVVAVQDPAYPVYVDSNVIAGRTGVATAGGYEGLVYLPCTAANGFFPEVPDRKVDLIYICSPNNPTGAVATRAQLEKFVAYARAHKAVILFDSAYSFFIRDAELPRSIYEIPGAEECAIEFSSFSKFAGFTGVRLGWTIVPKALVAEDGEAGRLHAMWTRRQNTFFNGASNVVQAGGLAVLSPAGMAACQGIIDLYMRNADAIREGLTTKGLQVYGGRNAPYVWLRTPNGLSSWDFFDKLLSECHVVGTPGSGFGPAGEGYFRLSAFGQPENTTAAIARIQERLKI
jgi:LL-diaminopimelate aminotransferase